MEMREIELEMKHLKDLDAQRQEFQGKLEESHEDLQSERRRADPWIQGITDLSMNEKQFYYYDY